MCASGAVRGHIWAGIEALLQPDLEAVSCDFLDSPHGSRWRVLLCFREMIHATTAQRDDEGDARDFAGVGCQGRNELKGHQFTEVVKLVTPMTPMMHSS